MSSDDHPFIHLHDQLHTLGMQLTATQSVTLLGDLAQATGQQVLAYTYRRAQGDSIMWTVEDLPTGMDTAAALLSMHQTIHAATENLRLALLDAGRSANASIVTHI
jgi:hypothetical protein